MSNNEMYSTVNDGTSELDNKVCKKTNVYTPFHSSSSSSSSINCAKAKVRKEDDIAFEENSSSVGIYSIATGSTLESKRPRRDVFEAKPETASTPHKYRKWLVLAAAFYSSFCSAFFIHMSVLYVEFLDKFGKSEAETALVQSVSAGMILSPGLITGTVIAEYGVRICGIFGGLLVTVGLSSSFFATSIFYLVISAGFIAGAGGNITFMCASTTVGEYFHDKSKFVALSFVSTGIGFGAMAFPYLLDFLIDSFGWRGSMLIVGGLMANMIPFFAICKPLHVGVKQPTASLCKSFPKCFQCPQRGKNTDSYSINVSVGSRISQKANFCQNKSDSFFFKDQVLLRQKAYIIFIIAMLFSVPVMNSIIVFQIKFLQSKGFDKDTSIFLYLCLSISSTIFRLVPGICKYIPHLSALLIPAFYTGSGVVICALLPTATSFIQHVVLMAGLGMVLGGIITAISMTTMKLVGLKYYTTGLGILMSTLGIGNICSGSISGYMTDATGSYSLSLYTVSAAFGVATCLFCLGTFIRKYDGETISKVEEYLKNRSQYNKKRTSVFPVSCK